MAYVVGGAFSYIDPVDIGWRLMFAFAAVPSVIQFIGFLFLPQSPRFAFEKEGIEACEKVFEKIYEHNEDWIQYEIAELRVALERAERIKALHNGAHVLFRVFSTPHLRKALFVGCALQIFQQASGINTILYFTDTLFKSAGIIGNTYSIFLSVGPAGKCT
uniref:Major facilitator superfamily (MFS) profile domain-containing protein n=1 Tax=Acrobeloides nanus TaxID=290746 RepID=A0A914BY64_9BILA